MAINDAFPYSDGALSGQAAWATSIYDGSLTVSSNAVAGTANQTRGNVRTDSWGAAQSSQIEWTGTGTSVFSGVVVHVTGSGATWSGYSFGIGNNGAWYLERIDAGAAATPALANGNDAGMTVGETIRIAIEGDDVVAYRGASELARVADTTYRSGQPGFYKYRESFEALLDNWSGTGEAASNNRVVLKMIQLCG